MILHVLRTLAIGLCCLHSLPLYAESLPKVTGLSLSGDRLTWDAQEGATGYNIHLDYEYHDTVRGALEYTVTLPGKYHVISFNDQGDYGVSRDPDEIGQPYTFVEFTHTGAVTLPKITGLSLEGSRLSWDAQTGATGYNIYRDYEYFDTVRGVQTYQLTEPGSYHVISFNDLGQFGVSRDPEEGGLPYDHVDYDGCVDQPELDSSCEPALVLSDADYFKEVVLNSEYGSSVGRVRKWVTDIRYSVAGDTSEDLLTELDRVVAELNSLVDIRLLPVADPAQANFHIFFGSGEDYAKQFEPNAADLVTYNYGLTWIYWNSSYELLRGSMYVDVYRASDQAFQHHLLREELTQSLGMTYDSFKYVDSIFYQPYSLVTEFSAIDREIIQSLYSDSVLPGMTGDDLDQLLQ